MCLFILLLYTSVYKYIAETFARRYVVASCTVHCIILDTCVYSVLLRHVFVLHLYDYTEQLF